MRLSVIFELLLIFLLIAFAAYGRVIERTSDGRAIAGKKAAVTKGSAATSLKQATDNVNKYCVCNENICNCCRDFHIPLVQLSGPGCASLQYLQDDKLAMQLSIGDNILSSNVVNGKNPKPVCVALPGGFSKFCGKIYSIKREADKNFKACLGLELRSASELEASLRVSCFRFGPDGLKLRPAEPIPASLSKPSTSSDDDYDFFGLDDDDEDDDDDDEEEDEDDQKASDPESNSVTGTATSEQQEQVQDPEEQEEEDDDDILGLGALFDIFAGEDEETTKKKKVTTPTPLPPSFAIPILSLTTTASPSSLESLVIKNTTATSTSSEANSPISPDDLSILNSEETSTEIVNNDELNKITPAAEKESNVATEKVISQDTTTIANIGLNEKNSVTGQSNKVTGIKVINIKTADKIKLKKVVVPISKKKVSVTPQTVDAIINTNTLKPQEEEQTTATNDNSDDEYEYNDSQSDEIEDSDEEKLENDEKENEDDEDNKQVSNDKDDEGDDDEEAEDDDEEDDETAEAVVDDDDDDDEEEEEAVLSALIDDENKNSNEESNKNKKKNDKTNTNKTKDEGDYDDLAELLARKHPSSRAVEHENKNLRTISRQSKVMRI